ncbi:MAG: TetR/AcrR family transcriptional regulator [Solirubrobacteraceae bacterium]|nr:TetR/AcrR family transcriptional regulator [Solirubrobacteraceae bacterium]
MSDFSAEPTATQTDEELAEIVLDLAQGSFIEHGFRGTKMEHLAKRAGVSVGQLYHVFANKQALYVAVHERAQRTFMTEYLEPAYALDPGEGGAIAHFAAIARAYLRFYIDHREMGPLLMTVGQEDQHEESIERLQRDMSSRVLSGLARLHQIVVDGVASGEVRADINPDEVIRWYWGGFYGVLALNLRHPSAALDDEALERVVEVGLESITALLRPSA